MLLRSCEIAENDVIGLVTLVTSGMGMDQFMLYSASNAGYGELALQIAVPITSI